MEKLIIIKTLTALAELTDYIKDKEFIAFDTETDGVLKTSHIIGFSICADTEVGYYVITRAWNPITKALEPQETLEGAKAFMELLKTKSLIMQNSPFDCSMVVQNYGVNLMESVHTDTMILGHILDENRSNGLKELGVSLFGEDARKEQQEVKASVLKNGGVLTKQHYELFKADAELLARYGAKDAILTLKIFYALTPILFEEGLDAFFYDDESMPLIKGPTYDMNTTGLRVDPHKLQELKGILETDCHEAKSFIHTQITPLVSEKYPGTKPSNTFNIGASKQMAWLLYFELDNDFDKLTKGGRELCKALQVKNPYTKVQKREFIRMCVDMKGRIYEEGKWNPKTKKIGRPKKIADPWHYIASDKASLKKLENKYTWVKKYLEYAKNLKLLNTYVEGIQERMQYNIIRPSFLQHGTTSGRYSSKNPNFQNLPRDDKRVKSCIISRPGKVFVGADYSQLEPRVFASFANDERLLKCFSSGEDFYSVIGAEVFDKFGLSLKKDDKDSFAKKHPDLRQIAKTIALSATYGTTSHKMAPALGKTTEEAQEIIDDYFEKFPNIKNLMLESHKMAKEDGKVTNLFGRPRRMPLAKNIKKLYGNKEHAELPYEARNLLNLAINHRIQSTGASIMNRAAIAFWKACKTKGWTDVKIVMQIHDELVVEGPEELAEEIVQVLKYTMENTVTLPGVDLIAEPKVAKNLGDLK